MRRSHLTRIVLILLQTVLITTTFFAGAYARDLIGWPGNSYPLFEEARGLLGSHGLKPAPVGSSLEYGMIRGMLTTYDDPYTIFVAPPQHELETNTFSGKYGGVGTRMERGKDGSFVLFPYPDSPASQAGIQDGDQVIQIDDLKLTAETSNDDAAAAVRGPEGEPVTLIILRPPEMTQLTFTIKRAEIMLPSVTWNVVPDEPSVGIIQIRVIAETTPTEVDKAITDLLSRQVKAVILDLRNNGGGLVIGGVNTARLFLKAGVVMEQQYRGEPVRQFEVESPGKYADLPIAILVNHNSASASEIIAGALQGAHRAQLVGTATYGKDTIQIVFDLKDESSLHVTAAHWWIPSLKEPIAGKGLTPDIVLSDEQANTVEAQARAVEALVAP